jgi:uncharacterized protein (TIGR03435 family)
MVRRVGWVLAGLMFAPMAYGQDAPGRLTFEVASIRPSTANDLNGGIKALPGGREYTSRNVPIKLIISLMYKVPMRQIEGGPGWLASDRYDIEAKADHSYNIDELHVMFQNLLADRFKLKFHKEVREGNVYALTVDKPGLKMKVNESPEDFNIPMNPSPEGFVGKRVPMPYLCWFLGQTLQADGRPVIDNTGLAGKYDFTLTFAPVLPPDVSRDSLSAGVRDRPSIFDALREQLGLKLTAERGPVEYYVIDSVERPSDN